MSLSLTIGLLTSGANVCLKQKQEKIKTNHDAVEGGLG